MIDKEVKAYVRIDGSGRAVPNSLLLRKKKPKLGKWMEVDANVWQCCGPTTTTTTTCDLGAGETVLLARSYIGGITHMDTYDFNDDAAEACDAISAVNNDPDHYSFIMVPYVYVSPDYFYDPNLCEPLNGTYVIEEEQTYRVLILTEGVSEEYECTTTTTTKLQV